jgi:membrane protease YdiL (CAAX protease family)
MTISSPVRGWYPDPYGSGGLRFWDGDRWTAAVAGYPPYGYGYPPAPPDPPLDRTVARMRAADPRPWGARPAVLPLVASIVAVVLGTTATHVIRPSTFTGRFVTTVLVNALMYSLLGLAVWVAGREVAQRYGGWGATFGLRRPIAKDIGYIASGIGVAFVARIVVAVLANGLTNGRAGRESSNLPRVHTSSVAVDVLLVVLVVVLAPVVEEIIFRGLLLRTFMRRMPFWPAALLSTFIFAMFHTYEVATLVGAVTLAAVVATLGLTNCYLVRLTDRLAPGMAVHAAFNALATGILIWQASR